MRRYYRRKFKLKLKKETIYTICQVFLLGASGIITLSLTQKGRALTTIYRYLNQFLGWGTLALPIVLILLAFSFSKIKSKITRLNVLVGFTLSWLTLVGLTKSGEVGKEIWNNIENLLTEIGAVFTLFGSLVIGLVVLFDTSIDEVLTLIFKVISFLISFSKKYLLGGLLKKKPKPFFIQEKITA